MSLEGAVVDLADLDRMRKNSLERTRLCAAHAQKLKNEADHACGKFCALVLFGLGVVALFVGWTR